MTKYECVILTSESTTLITYLTSIKCALDINLIVLILNFKEENRNKNKESKEYDT